MNDESTVQPETWAIVELMGHVKMAGRLSDEERFGGKLGRLDVPNSSPCDCANAPPGEKLEALPSVTCEACGGTGVLQGFETTYFGAASVYRISIVTERVARVVAATRSQPVSPWDFPKAPPAIADGRQANDLYEEGDW